ncbi:hypothetical protein I6C35_21770, partial [Clostridioides difficile]|nr:hypothetical protein [Clostridioides difficile]
FMPIILAINAAKKFNVNTSIAVIVVGVFGNPEEMQGDQVGTLEKVWQEPGKGGERKKRGARKGEKEG